MVLRVLIEHRADIDLANNQQLTPLLVAAHQNKPECVAILAAAKASLEGAMEVGPISMAAQQGAEECVALLAYLGARLVEELNI